MIIAAKKNTCGLAAPVVLTLAFLAGCHSSSAPPAPVPTPQSTDPITLTGAISDGPVIGGSLFGFGADAITDALAAAATASDRAGALAAAGPLFQIARDVDGDEFFATEIDASLARSIVFLVFDSGESEDSEFGDTPPNMESILRLGVGHCRCKRRRGDRNAYLFSRRPRGRAGNSQNTQKNCRRTNAQGYFSCN
jgi:hypothetical protein